MANYHNVSKGFFVRRSQTHAVLSIDVVHILNPFSETLLDVMVSECPRRKKK